MKTCLAAILSIISLLSCGKKVTHSATQSHDTNTGAVPDCKGELAQITFINKKSVEIRVSISSKTSSKQGNTVVNSWKSFQTSAIAAGDSISVSLKKDEQFMYTVYGPVSTNVNGLGVIAEDKFILTGCEKRRQFL